MTVLYGTGSVQTPLDVHILLPDRIVVQEHATGEDVAPARIRDSQGLGGASYSTGHYTI